ncbi:MAG: acyltransferase [Paludibacteraceae bacterium]|nr:acyltransferase [Paludibacteraceae bacterium]
MNYTDTKQHYEILDGLRGVAAIMVVLTHITQSYAKDFFSFPIGHGYLAVDFFFVLSGFVIGYAYDDRWNKMTTLDFMKRRLIRLHPMVIAGSVIGAILFYFADCEIYPLIHDTKWWMLLIAFVLCSLMIPLPYSYDIRIRQEMFPTNGPQWTLFYEYVANIVYALVLRRLPTKILVALVVIAAFFTIDWGLGWNVLDKPGYFYIGLFEFGWSTNIPHVHVALVRLSYPFIAGLLLSRTKAYITLKGGFWWCALIIVLVLCWPHLGGYDQTTFWYNGLYETLCILLVFPLVVSIGAGSRMTDKRSTQICNFLGEISYPIYITHFPLIYIHEKWVFLNKEASLPIMIGEAVLVFCLSVGIAYALYRYYDLPVRKILKKKLLG